MSKSSSSIMFRIDNVILSHAHIFEPKRFEQNGVPQGDPFYSVVCLVSEEDAKLIYNRAMELAKGHYQKEEFNDPTFGWPVSAANLKPEYADNPRTAGLFMFNAKAGANFKPQIVHNVNGSYVPVEDKGSVYSGCIASIGINVFTRPQPARPGEVGCGVGVGLKAITKTADGDPLGGDSVDSNALFQGCAVPDEPSLGEVKSEMPATPFGSTSPPVTPFK